MMTMMLGRAGVAAAGRQTARMAQAAIAPLRTIQQLQDAAHKTLVSIAGWLIFRAGERTFDLLTQVAGRAGRGERPGRVLIQTYCPSHYAIRAASGHDYQTFYRAELAMRKRFHLPPFAHLIELTVSGTRREHVQETAEALSGALQTAAGRTHLSILGPAPHRVARVRGVSRWQLVVKTRALAPASRVIKRVLGDGRRFRGLPVTVDVDPL